MRDARFFRKPDFQLRDFGTSAPEASFSQNVSLSESEARHPVIVASPALERSFAEAAAFGAGSGAGGVAGGTSAIVVKSNDAGFGMELGAGVLITSTAGVFVFV